MKEKDLLGDVFHQMPLRCSSERPRKLSSGFADPREINITPHLGGQWFLSEQGESGQKETAVRESFPAHPRGPATWIAQALGTSRRAVD